MARLRDHQATASRRRSTSTSTSSGRPCSWNNTSSARSSSELRSCSYCCCCGADNQVKRWAHADKQACCWTWATRAARRVAGRRVEHFLRGSACVRHQDPELNCVQLWFSSALRRAKRLAYLFLSFFSCSATYGYAHGGWCRNRLTGLHWGGTYLALEEGELALNVLVRGLVLEGLVEREFGVAPLIEGRECLSLPEQGLDVARVQLQRLLCNIPGPSERVSVN